MEPATSGGERKTTIHTQGAGRCRRTDRRSERLHEDRSRSTFPVAARTAGESRNRRLRTQRQSRVPAQTLRSERRIDCCRYTLALVAREEVRRQKSAEGAARTQYKS